MAEKPPKTLLHHRRATSQLWDQRANLSMLERPTQTTQKTRVSSFNNRGTVYDLADRSHGGCCGLLHRAAVMLQTAIDDLSPVWDS